jgi:hypothetical protein
MEEKKQNGGKRKGAGRKSKAEEQSLVEKLSPLEPRALEVLYKAVEEEKQWAVKMYFEYMYGKAVETKEVKVTKERRIFSDSDLKK